MHMFVILLMISLVLVVTGRKGNKKEHRKVEPDYIEEEYTYLETIAQGANELPHHDDLLAIARYVMHIADTAALATMTNVSTTEEYPAINMKAMADGPYNQSTGVPYFLMSFAESFAHDLKKNSRSTIVVSVKPQKTCKVSEETENDPGCAIIALSGKIKKVNENTTEYKFAMDSLFERHISLSTYPPDIQNPLEVSPRREKSLDLDLFIALVSILRNRIRQNYLLDLEIDSCHGSLEKDKKWFVTKLKISKIALMDFHGEADYIPVRNYLNYTYTGPFIRVPKISSLM